MRGPDRTSIAVRKPDGNIELKVEENKNKNSTLRKTPFIRGIFSLIDSLKIGMDAIIYSSSFWEDEELEEESGFLDKFLEGKSDNFVNGLVILMSLAFSLVLFFFIPTLISSLFTKYINSTIILNLIEGIIRLIIFFAYLIIVSKTEDMKRIFMYHGAEHKTDRKSTRLNSSH